MRGRPLSCKCPKCKLKAVSGAYWKIWFRGETKDVLVQRKGRYGAALRTKYKNQCGRCNHKWWSSYRGILEAKQ